MILVTCAEIDNRLANRRARDRPDFFSILVLKLNLIKPLSWIEFSLFPDFGFLVAQYKPR